MTALETFCEKIRAEIAAAEGVPSSTQIAAEYMSAINERTAQFGAQADRILNDLVQPRLQLLSSFFPNAVPARLPAPWHCTWWFGYTERFPASTRLEFYASHDERVENFYLNYELLIVPVFVKYDRFDRFGVSIRQIDDAQMIDWLEKRLLAFLHTYLGLETSNRDQSEALALDPVCGMRIQKDRAAGSHDHAGHRYFFCSVSCREEFAKNPSRYVTVVTM